MEELVTNLHIHTRYSDGTGTHAQIAAIALNTGIDVLMITDHNLNVRGFDGYYQKGEKKLLMMVGEEIHDRTSIRAKNHLLVLGTDQEMSGEALDFQKLVQSVNDSGGFSIIAHPYERSLAWANEPDISWDAWEIKGIRGYELWNGFSEYKDRVQSKLSAIFFAFFPNFYPESPPERTLVKWDGLLADGKHVVAVGGSDAHSLRLGLGPLRATVFPYRFHFRGVNTHLLTPRLLSENLDADRGMIIEALKAGHAFVGYDRPSPTNGFRFNAQGKNETAEMGDEIQLKPGVTFQIRLPERVECRLIKDGKVLQTWHRQNYCTYITNQPGVYRVEAFIMYRGKRRGWIFSNPIYAKLPDKKE